MHSKHAKRTRLGLGSAGRPFTLAAAAAVCAAGLAGCGTPPEDVDESSAQVEPVPRMSDDGFIRLDSELPHTLDGGGTVEITGASGGSEAEIEVTENGSTTEHTLAFGDTVEIGGAQWRVSELAIDESEPPVVSIVLTPAG
ncbi:DUF6406 domain-containing protein [Allonocardiopsis opalescens]|uniref:Lipoprotein n=1 Tax=Allonocardiopsis opalescens TaxID=1144618 RepID=A0A2T0Q0T3_9ACTN|nr:DUF6406 domain-containing protein [Allonocardiopsis opalescens]PRX97376.1 hypothetical protein CLV72_106414 [Allonocardiopsis opalescens]